MKINWLWSELWGTPVEVHLTGNQLFALGLGLGLALLRVLTVLLSA